MARGEKSGDERAAHVGFYLIDKGLSELERTAPVRRSTAEALRRMSRRFPLSLYLGAILLTTAMLTGTLLAMAHAGGVSGWLVALVGLLSILCTGHLAVALS